MSECVGRQRLRLGRLAIATYVTFYCREGISDDYSAF